MIDKNNKNSILHNFLTLSKCVQNTHNLAQKSHQKRLSRGQPFFFVILLTTYGLFAAQVRVNARSRSFACAHRLDDRCRSGNRVAACEDAFAVGRCAVVCADTTFLVRFQMIGGVKNQRVQLGTDGHDDHIDRNLEVGALLDDRFSSAGSVRFAEFHFHTFDGSDVTGLIAEDLDRIVLQVQELKKQVDIVAVSLHWGIHFIPAVIAQYQRLAGHAIIDAGADIILGHHTHILKPMEVYKGKPIIYSMANFALEPPFMFAEDLEQFNKSAQHKEIQSLNPDWKKMPSKPMPADSYKSLLLKVKIQDKKITDVSFIPVQLDDDSNPRTLTEKDSEFMEIVHYMEEITKDQSLETEYEVYHGEVYLIRKK